MSESPEGNPQVVERRRLMLEVDLNYPLPDWNMALTDPQDLQAQHIGPSQREPMNNAEFIDEEVVVISPRKFAEAVNNSQRNHSRRSCEVIGRLHEPAEAYSGISESTNRVPSHIKHRLTRKNAVYNWELYMNSEVHDKIKTNNLSISPEMPQGVSQNEPFIFSCVICMGQMIEETSTKCGHIFCKKCIEAAIATQHKCPTCRRKLKKRDIFRVYLPTAS